MSLVGKKAPAFKAAAVINGEEIVENFSLEQYIGKKHVVFFFTFRFYTGKKVPSQWSSKVNYRHKLIKIISKDESFADYISKMENVVHVNPVIGNGSVPVESKENKNITCKTGFNFYPGAGSGAGTSPNKLCKTETKFCPSPQTRLKTGFKESKLSKKDDPYQLLDDYFPRLTTTGKHFCFKFRYIYFYSEEKLD
jgi:hypothetical protein